MLCAVGVIAYLALIIFRLPPPMRSFGRRSEKLPSVSVGAGNVVYCRMRYCDFRFPLPERSACRAYWYRERT